MPGSHSRRLCVEPLEERTLLSINGFGALDVEIDPPEDTTAPEAMATAVDVTRAGGSSHLIRVQYTDNVAVDVSDIDGADLRVVGPDGFDEAATMVFGNAGFDGTPRWAYYRIAAPDGSWDPADNGVYTMVMQADQVSDTSDNFVAAGDLGTFTVDIVAPPEASLTVANITEESNETHQFQVEYSGEEAIDVSDLDNRDLWVRGPRFWQYATFVEADSQDDATPVVATYEITAPGHDWDSTDNGTYQVYMLSGAVTDTGGHFVRSGLLGTFDVEIDPPLAAVLAAVDEALATTDFG